MSGEIRHRRRRSVTSADTGCVAARVAHADEEGQIDRETRHVEQSGALRWAHMTGRRHPPASPAPLATPVARPQQKRLGARKPIWATRYWARFYDTARDRVICPLCEKRFHVLAQHVIKIHGYASLHEFKAEFGIGRGVSMISIRMYERILDLQAPRLRRGFTPDEHKRACLAPRPARMRTLPAAVSREATGRAMTPAVRARAAETIRAVKRTPEARARQSTVSRQLWLRPEYRARLLHVFRQRANDPKWRARMRRISAASRAQLRADPVRYAQWRQHISGTHLARRAADPTFGATNAEALRAATQRIWGNPARAAAMRRKFSRAQKHAQRANPALLERRRSLMRVAKAKQLAVLRARWHPCAVCGRSIPPYRKVCSRPCYYAYRWRGQGYTLPIRVCPHCGLTFQTSATKARFCSQHRAARDRLA